MVQQLMQFITGLIGIIVPEQVGTAWTNVLGYAGALNGIFPIETGIQITLFLLSVLILRYSVELILFVFHLLPWVGTNEQAELPSHR